MSGTWGSQDIRGYERSLEVAADLWTLAGAFEAMARSRYTTAGTALQQWRGPFTAQFEDCVAKEVKALNEAAQQMREGARHWALAWKMCMDENNRRRRARRVDELAEEKRSHRGWLERNVGDHVLGDDSRKLAEREVPAAREVPVPSAPAFAPTDAPQHF